MDLAKGSNADQKLNQRLQWTLAVACPTEPGRLLQKNVKHLDLKDPV